MLSRELESFNGMILDNGCGQGISRNYMKNVIYTGIDLTFHKSQKKRENLVVASATKLPFINECFDGVLFLDVIEHINSPNDRESLTEVYRTLKFDGRMIISTPNIETIFHGESFVEKDHVNCMSSYILKNKIVTSNLKIIRRIPGDIFIIPPYRWLLRIPLRIRRLLARIYSRFDKYQIYEIRKEAK